MDIPFESDICNVCSSPLVVNKNNETIKCFYCKKESIPGVMCPKGHYICDECHSASGKTIIDSYCLSTTNTDPFLIASEIMHHSEFQMAGPEHHILVPAVLITMLKNLHIKNPDGEEMTNQHIKKAIKKASVIPGGWCGFYGACGAGIGSGLAIAIFLNSTPSSDHPRTLANQTTARSLTKIADDIEHCCKRSVIHAIETAIEQLNQSFNLDLPFKAHSCEFSGINPKCEHTLCPCFER